MQLEHVVIYASHSFGNTISTVDRDIAVVLGLLISSYDITIEASQCCFADDYTFIRSYR